jgi:hypothetical protein
VTLAVCGALLASGAFIDEYFIAEDHREWARAKVQALHAGLELEKQTAEELEEYAQTPLFWSENLFSRDLLNDKYFWGGALFTLFMSVDVNERIATNWLRGGIISQNIGAMCLVVLGVIYSIVCFRFLVYRAQPEFGRFATNLLLALLVGAGFWTVASWRLPDDTAGDAFLYCLQTALASTTAALVAAVAMLCPVLFSRTARFTISKVLAAAANPSKSPYKFAAVGLGALVGLAKALHDLLS